MCLTRSTRDGPIPALHSRLPDCREANDKDSDGVFKITSSRRVLYSFCAKRAEEEVLIQLVSSSTVTEFRL